mgnify:CR=1 FL=1
MYASDFHMADIEAIMQIMPLVMLFNATIDIVHVTGDATSSETVAKADMRLFIDKLREHTSYADIVPTVLPGKDIPGDIEGYASICRSDLLILSTKRKTMLERIFEQSVTQALVNHTKIPLMVFHYEVQGEPVYIF